MPIIGGMSVPKQERLLSYKPDIVVATPGRLWDLHELGNEYLNHLDDAKWVVLDEADRLIQGNHFKEMDMLFEKLQMKKMAEAGKKGMDLNPKIAIMTLINRKKTPNFFVFCYFNRPKHANSQKFAF